MPAQINGLDSTPVNPPTTADRTGSSKLGKDEFLKLLMAQMANQDPTAPTDNGQFVAQLAQFAGLEAAQGTNSRLDTLLIAQANNNQQNFVNFIGKDVVYRTDALNMEKGLTATASATLPANADKVTVNIVDGNGRTVRTMRLGPQPAGPLNIAWDGNDDSGTPQPSGRYSVKATATDAAGADIKVDMASTGRVTGVEFTNGIPKLSVNGTQINMSEVTSINERNTP
jgi:flagellar basal-body rod modification protein FlgD